MNTVVLEGNVGADPRILKFETGTLCTFNLATSERWTDKAGRRQERTDWHPVVVKGDLAAVVSAVVKKGNRVVVIGSYRERDWTDAANQPRKSREISARTVALSILPAPRDAAATGDRHVPTRDPAAEEDIAF